ncbi:hypothetical protein TSAR_015164 [Trichomalopsis sarcophagae]|uniref:Uncharacterized protein n=1 Tax=Trichomalopsis sarcophagae TaxID=543379 RepID=A0A232EIL5_9HYME|nr:hypothetical protein TSAR_015164 [Trichomalopsis sarcophagae]
MVLRSQNRQRKGSETVFKEVDFIGLYYGPEKPSDLNELIKAFVIELNELIKDEIEYGRKIYRVKLQCLFCDAPAKAYILKVKYHTGYYSKIGVLRTDQGFKDCSYVDDGLNDNYQQDKAILCDVFGFGLVTNVVLDYMHLICLGVVLKLIELWISGQTTVKLSDQERQLISDKLVNLKNFMPSDFSRKPRQLQNDSGYLKLADELLNCFVTDFEMIYGCKNVTFNIDNLLHVVSDVENFGCLDNYSAFRFENNKLLAGYQK